MTWGRSGASPARQRGAPGPGVAGTPRSQPRLAPRPRTRAHHSPPAASPCLFASAFRASPGPRASVFAGQRRLRKAGRGRAQNPASGRPSRRRAALGSRTRKRRGRAVLLHTLRRCFLKAAHRRGRFCHPGVTASSPPPAPTLHTAATQTLLGTVLLRPPAQDGSHQGRRGPGSACPRGTISLPTLPPVFTALEMKTKRSCNKQTQYALT